MEIDDDDIPSETWAAARAVFQREAWEEWGLSPGSVALALHYPLDERWLGGGEMPHWPISGASFEAIGKERWMERKRDNARAYTGLPMTPGQVTELCGAAAQAWNVATTRTEMVRFEWRGKQYVSNRDVFGMNVYAPNGLPICCRRD